MTYLPEQIQPPRTDMVQPVEIVGPSQRADVLNLAVQNCIAKGWRVEAITPPSGAVLVSGHRVNHVLHAILTVLMCGLWGVVWIIVASSTHEYRMTVTIDAYGRPVYSRPIVSR